MILTGLKTITKCPYSVQLRSFLLYCITMQIRYKLRQIITVFVIGIFPYILAAQMRDADIKFRLAQSHERGGNYEAAVKLYEELYAKDSLNYGIFDALKRCYLQLKQNEDAIRLIERRLLFTPNDIGLMAELGSIYLRAMDERRAYDVWERAIAINPKNETTYRIVASAMIESRAIERAVLTYKRGRESCGNPNLFTSDVAYLYSIILNYADATREYLNLLKENPAQLGYVQSRMATYTSRTDGLSSALSVVEQALQSEPNSVSLLHLLSWLYMEGKRYDRAYEVAKRVDVATKAGGKELFAFAERAFKDKAYNAALKSYRDIIDQYSSFPQLAQAKFGYARTLEESSAVPDTLYLFGYSEITNTDIKPVTESEAGFTGALAAYQRVVTEHPATEFAARSILRIAALHYKRFFNLDAAQSNIETLLKHYSNFIPIVLETKILLSEINIVAGKLDSAERLLNELATARFVSPDQQQVIALRLAELAYFRGNFQDALLRLQSVTKQVTTDVANDAIELQIFIQENQQTGEAVLKDFARAELLRRQQKLSESLTLFQSIAQLEAGSSVREYAAMRIGDLYAQMRRYNDAIEAYDLLAKNFSESILLDRALMKTGYIYQIGLREKEKAISVYQKLLETYPQSLYVNEARKRIRELRGDTL